MLTYNDLDQDQLDVITRIYEHDVNFIYAGMGAGKTVCTLTAVDELLKDGEITRALIVAPLRPAREVWACEHKKWAHLEHLDVAVACGTPAQRLKAINESDAPIVVINIENLVWFLEAFKRTHNFDCLVIDELSKFGSNSSRSVKKLRVYTDTFKHRTGLTASPVHESFERLFAQTLVLDGGARFGRNKEKFLMAYFYPTDYERRNWKLLPHRKEALLNKIDDILYAMPDYTHTLPPLNEHHSRFDLHDDTKAIYAKMSADNVVYLDGIEILAENEAVLQGKLEQFTSGFVYVDENTVCDLSAHKERQACFKFQRAAMHERNCLIFYLFEEEKQQIIDALGDDYSLITDADAVRDWNAGKIRNLVLHPRSASHGLNLARGGHTIICYSPIWSNDMFKQLIARLWRRGQKHAVDVFTLVCNDSVDLIKLDRLEEKEENDVELNSHIKSR